MIHKKRVGRLTISKDRSGRTNEIERYRIILNMENGRGLVADGYKSGDEVELGNGGEEVLLADALLKLFSAYPDNSKTLRKFFAKTNTISQAEKELIIKHQELM